jgi:hypothetical protein
MMREPSDRSPYFCWFSLSKIFENPLSKERRE